MQISDKFTQVRKRNHENSLHLIQARNREIEEVLHSNFDEHTKDRLIKEIGERY